MKLCALTIFLVVLTACTKEVGYRYDFPGDAIAVSARIDPAEGVRAFVTRGVPPQGKFNVSELALPDARVEVVREDGNRFRAAFKAGAEFVAAPDTAIVAGWRYRLEVSHPDYPPVVSEWVTVPPAITNATVTRTNGRDPDSNEEVSVLSFTATDAAGPDYYLIEVYPMGYPTYQFQNRFAAAFNTEFCEFYNYHPSTGVFFPDRCFDGEAWSFTMAVTDREFLTAGNSLAYGDFLFVIRHLDATYWSFLQDRVNLDDIRGSILEASAPSTANVTGGYGVFLASNSFVRVFSVN